MQALTPLLFSMLFPRASPSSPADVPPDNDDLSHEALLANRRRHRHSYHYLNTDNVTAFEGIHQDQDQTHQRLSVKARRHHSTGLTRYRSAPALLDQDQQQQSSGVSTDCQAPRPKRLSLDNAAYRATYPSLDGLGDLGRASSMDYYGPGSSAQYAQAHANAAVHIKGCSCACSRMTTQGPRMDSSMSSSPRSPSRSGTAAAGSIKAQKQSRSGSGTRQDSTDSASSTLSRASTSSIRSSLSEAPTMTSMCSSSASTLWEPLTPTARSPNYHSTETFDHQIPFAIHASKPKSPKTMACVRNKGLATAADSTLTGSLDNSDLEETLRQEQSGGRAAADTATMLESISGAVHGRQQLIAH